MPSVKMKTKSTAVCLIEKNSLHVCQKSSIISKNSLSRVKISQQAAELETCIPNSQDVSLCKRHYVQDNGSDGSNHIFDGENFQSHKQLSPLTDSAPVGRVESTPATCTSNLETIFSPILESIGIYGELNVHCDGGSDKHLDVPPFGEDNSDENSGSSFEYQTCTVSDFYISDTIVSGLPIEGNLIDDDIPDSTCLPDYKCDEPSMFINVAEEYMMLPFLEDTVEVSCGHDNKTFEQRISQLDDSSLHFVIHQLRSCDQDSDVNFYVDSDQAEFFDPHLFIRNLPDGPDLSDVSLCSQATLLPKETRKMRPVTLVLDLDETLVHSTLEQCDNADFTFSVFFNMKDHTVYVNQRPYLQTFLERVAEMFEIVVFTASQSIYAKQLLDTLDPNGKLFSRRAYRESCILSDGNYTKDLTVLGVDLAKVAIIDNSPQVFRWQVNNGIPIKSWFDDSSDCELISLLPFLETLVDADDVRSLIAKRFGN